MKITEDIFKSIFSEGVWISITISLKFVPKGPIDYKSALVQAPKRRETITRINADQIHRRIYTALGGNEITKSGRSFHWGLVHLVQSASICWNTPKIFHTVFETLPVGAKSLPILPPDYWHPPQSNFTEYKQDVVAVFYAPVNGQWVNQQALYFLGLSGLTHICQVPCMTGQLGQHWLSQLTKDCQPSDCTEEHYVSLPGMEHMSVELRKNIWLFIYMA